MLIIWWITGNLVPLHAVYELDLTISNGKD